MHVLPQLVVVHVLSGGEGGGDGRVDAAQVQPPGARRGGRQVPRCGPCSTEQRTHGSQRPAEQHGDSARGGLRSLREQLPGKPRRVNQQPALVDINLVTGPTLSLKSDRFALLLMCLQPARQIVQPFDNNFNFDHVTFCKIVKKDLQLPLPVSRAHCFR